MLAAAGRDKVLVHPRPRVSVIAVGDELVDVARTPGAGQVAGRLLLRAHRRRPRRRRRGRPGRAACAATRASWPRRCRTGCRSPTSSWCAGPSAVRRGRRSQAALADLGELDTTRVAMHPGSTQGFGRLGPDGCPRSCSRPTRPRRCVLFEVLVRPLIRLALGLRRPVPPHGRRPADLAGHVPPGRRGYLRGRLLRDRRGRLPRAAARHRRHAPAVVAGRGNGLIVLPEDVTEADRRTRAVPWRSCRTRA